MDGVDGLDRFDFVEPGTLFELVADTRVVDRRRCMVGDVRLFFNLRIPGETGGVLLSG